MASKDVTRFFGSIRFVLPLVLIFFIAAGSAIACPNHTGKAAHRTKSLNTRTVSYMAPVVINYGGRCADSRMSTRRVRYVRDNGYYEGGTRYVAVRRSVPRTRYVAVRDLDVQPRYVAVRNYAPRQKMVEVRHFDDGYVRPTYVGVQRVPVVDDYFDRVRTTRTVAVRRVSNPCERVVTCGNRLDDLETTSMRRVVYRDAVPAGTRHVVVKTDMIAGTEEVITPEPSYDDSAFVDTMDNDVLAATDATYTAPVADLDVAYAAPSTDVAVAYVAERDSAMNPCTPVEPIEPCSGAIARTVGYDQAVYDDIDFDDQAFLDTDDVTYVAAGDVEDACLSSVVVTEPRSVVTTRAVSYVPADDVEVDTFDSDLEPVAAAPAVIDAEPVDAMPVNYVPVETVQYVPVETVEVVPVEFVEADCPEELSIDGAATVSVIPNDDDIVEDEFVDSELDLNDVGYVDHDVDVDGLETVWIDDSA